MKIVKERAFVYSYCKDLGRGKMQHNFGNKKRSGGINNLKYHLTRMPCLDVKSCPDVPIYVAHQENANLETIEAAKVKRQKLGAETGYGSSSKSRVQGLY